MSNHAIENIIVPRSSEPAREVWRGVLTGLIPLGLLVAVVIASMLLAALARVLFFSAGFFAQQQAAVIVLIAGLVLAIVVFAVAVWRILRRVAVWQQGEAKGAANAGLWTLGVTALLIMVPVLLALLLPQHPFP